jgi:pre-mRNA-processing factor 6
LKICSKCEKLWVPLSLLEEQGNVVKARSILDIFRLKIPRNPTLWVHAIRLERRSGNEKMAATLMAKALQECPNSGLLRAEAIRNASRTEQKSRCADAIKRCPDDPLVISAVASLFASERKYDKARKWFERAVALNPDIGDSWAQFYSFELTYGTAEHQQNIMVRCKKAEPRHGELWCRVAKDMKNRRKTTEELLHLVTKDLSK